MAEEVGNPYRLPDDGKFRSINVSGGRSSGYMLFHILQGHGGRLPDHCAAVFANTGREREATLAFVEEMQERWNVPIAWVEYEYAADARGGRTDPKHRHRVVDRKSASRCGEPFRQMVRQERILPNAVMRTCTKKLKVETIKRYCTRTLGVAAKTQRRVVGYRYDEPSRWGDALYTQCEMEYPMVHARVVHEDVQRWWAAQEFDLGMDSWEGNCDGCFLKGEKLLLLEMRRHPDLAQWWIEVEEGMVALRKEEGELNDLTHARFSKRWSYRELQERAQRTPEFPWSEEEARGERIECGCGG